MQRSIDGQVMYGYLGLFAYLRVSIVDLATWRIVREREVIASTTHREPHNEPWDSMTGEEKVRVLRRLIETEVAAALVGALAGLQE